MTLRSLKGTKITTLSGLTRDTTTSIWKEDVTPASAKDNPLALTVIKDLIDDVVSRLTGGLIEGYAPTDFVWLYGAAIDVSGSIYTVTEAAYALYNGEVYKVNTGSATLTDTIVLELSATEDGMYRTLDIADGASGSGVVDYADIKTIQGLQINASNGNVSIPNGTLTVGDGTTATQSLFVNASSGGNAIVEFQNASSTRFSIGTDDNVTFALKNSSGTNILTADRDTQDVSIPNGDLTVGTDQTGASSISIDSADATKDKWQFGSTDSGGEALLEVTDADLAKVVLRLNGDNGGVTVPNGHIESADYIKSGAGDDEGFYSNGGTYGSFPADNVWRDVILISEPGIYMYYANLQFTTGSSYIKVMALSSGSDTVSSLVQLQLYDSNNFFSRINGNYIQARNNNFQANLQWRLIMLTSL